MTAGENIRAARRKAGLTQSQLAARSGVAAISIHQYEKGKRVPRLEQIYKIADALGIPYYELLDYEAYGNLKQSREEINVLKEKLEAAAGEERGELEALLAEKEAACERLAASIALRQGAPDDSPAPLPTGGKIVVDADSPAAEIVEALEGLSPQQARAVADAMKSMINAVIAASEGSWRKRGGDKKEAVSDAANAGDGKSD